MARKASMPAKKTGTAKSNVKGKVNKGDSVVCEVCGLSVVVEEVGGVATAEETTLYCCGEPMKPRKAAPRVKAAKRGQSERTLSGWPMSQAAGSSGPVADPNEDVTQQ